MVTLRSSVVPGVLLFTAQAFANLPLWPWENIYQPWSSGCNVSHASGFNNATDSHWVLSGGQKRFYGVYVPDDYDSNKPYPLIFDYHASMKTPWDQYDNSQYYNNSLGQDYVVVYPQGIDGYWQGPDYAAPGVDDLQFTTDLLAHIKAQYCVDANHIYASGKSNGAGFVNTLACSTNGDDFAAFAMASAALYTDTSLNDCPYKRAILESHGLKDTTVPYDGGDGNGGDLPDISVWVEWWGTRDCGKSSSSDGSNSTSHGYITTTYSCGNWQDVVQHYTVNDLGHCWPSSDGNNYDAQTSTDCQVKVLDFTSAVLAFFAKWDKSNAPGPQ